jgi:hypothetical protein
LSNQATIPTVKRFFTVGQFNKKTPKKMHSKYDNWQPMATAPTDGTEITVLYVHLCSENCYGKKQGLCSDKCEGCFLPPMEHAASYDVSAGLHMCEFRTPILWEPKNTNSADSIAEVPKGEVRQVDVFTFFEEELAGIVGSKTRIFTQSAKLCFTIPLDGWLWQRVRELLELTAACEGAILGNKGETFIS